MGFSNDTDGKQKITKITSNINIILQCNVIQTAHFHSILKTISSVL